MSSGGFEEATPMGSLQPVLGESQESGPHPREIPLPPARSDDPWTRASELPPGSTARNGLAVASLVSSVFCGGVVGLLLGVMALKAARDGKATNRELAVVAVAVNVLMLVVGVVVGVMIFVSATSTDTSDTPSAAPLFVDVWSVEVGDCVLQPTEQDDLSGFMVVGCASPHWGEVFHLDEHPAGPYPGDETALQRSKDLCLSDTAQERITPAIPDNVYLYTVWPGETGWAGGDRGVTCLLYADDGLLDTSYVLPE